MLFSRLKRMRMAHRLRRQHISSAQWHALIDSIRSLRRLSAVERTHLQTLTLQFLKHKTINGVQGLSVSPQMRLRIAAQACLLILHLDFSYFDNWHEVVLYPGSFRVRHPLTTENGLVNEQAATLSGEAWQQGPVILSWDDAQRDMQGKRPGSNVVIHEFAHKLDMLSGSANGSPPMHPDMSQAAWTKALSTAYERLQHELGHRHTCINPYGATNPGEFFAVISEYFFTAPQQLFRRCPKVYQQLRLFYRQDPRRNADATPG